MQLVHVHIYKYTTIYGLHHELIDIYLIYRYIHVSKYILYLNRLTAFKGIYFVVYV